MKKNRFLLGSTIVLYFVIGLEILIMISPFAGFFYAVFNPFLLAVARYPATRWLSAFYLPHMVVPPDGPLVAIRVLGSTLFVAGLAVFLFCAGQVYTAKFRKKGAVTQGLYRWIRHPQYLALGISGVGLSILWPRFLVAALWCVMILAYYALALDEERRMLAAHGEVYRPYMERTGMILPRMIESRILPAGNFRRFVAFPVLAAVVIGGAFGLRSYTIHHLTLWGEGNVAAVAILPEDGFKMEHRMGDILELPEVRSRLSEDADYLVYVMPVNYIMQGLIADTGGAWKLYKHHHSLSMMTDWILHPFRHLREGHKMHGRNHAGTGGISHGGHRKHMAAGGVSGQGGQGVLRRLIVLRIENAPAGAFPYNLFSMNARRMPVLMADVEFHELKLLSIKDLPPGETGWGRVPTPTF